MVWNSDGGTRPVRPSHRAQRTTSGLHSPRSTLFTTAWATRLFTCLPPVTVLTTRTRVMTKRHRKTHRFQTSTADPSRTVRMGGPGGLAECWTRDSPIPIEPPSGSPGPSTRSSPRRSTAERGSGGRQRRPLAYRGRQSPGLMPASIAAVGTAARLGDRPIATVATITWPVGVEATMRVPCRAGRRAPAAPSGRRAGRIDLAPLRGLRSSRRSRRPGWWETGSPRPVRGSQR